MADQIRVKAPNGKTLTAWVNYADLLRYDEGLSRAGELDGVEVEVDVDNPETGEAFMPIIMPLTSFLDLWDLMSDPA